MIRRHFPQSAVAAGVASALPVPMAWAQMAAVQGEVVADELVPFEREY